MGRIQDFFKSRCGFGPRQPDPFGIEHPPWTSTELLEQEIEQLRVQLANCLMAAEGNTDNVAKQGDYGWSPACQAVLDLRERYDLGVFGEYEKGKVQDDEDRSPKTNKKLRVGRDFDAWGVKDAKGNLLLLEPHGLKKSDVIAHDDFLKDSGDKAVRIKLIEVG